MISRFSRFLIGLGEGFGAPLEARAFRWTLALIVFFFPFGVVFVSLDLLPVKFSWFAAVTVGAYAFLCLLSEIRMTGRTAALTQFFALSLPLFAVEIIGVKTGFPFGRYAYSELLGPAPGGVPIVIPLAWYATVICSWRVAQYWKRISSHWLLVPSVAGMITLAFDITLEPMATSLGYWRWEGGGVPLQNYASWMILSGCAAGFLERAARGGPGPLPAGMLTGGLVLLLQWVLFAATNALRGNFGLTLLSAFIVLLGGVIFSTLPQPRTEKSP